MNMDRFKFRVWDIKNKRYGLSPYTRRIDDIITVIEPPASNNQFIIEQCTGLKDKNDKLIYEGDILHGKYANGEDYYCIVEWYQGKFVTHDERGLNMVWGNGLEIIGNIHESEAYKTGVEIGNSVFNKAIEEVEQENQRKHKTYGAVTDAEGARLDHSSYSDLGHCDRHGNFTN